jgi:uncharacterized protein GlcG (DUF336 family)
MKKISMAVSAAVLALAAQGAMAACSDIATNHAALQAAADAAAAVDTGGYGLPMWVTAVDETGKVCFVVTSDPANSAGATGAAGGTYWSSTNGASADTGDDVGNKQWLGSRVISAQKANTANAFSVNGYAISTANLNTAVLPGNSLYGLQHSNPVDASRAYGGSPNTYGTNSDFLKNKRIGGVNVFGGGLALYDGTTKVGAIGVSGDTSCRDHAFAWVVRQQLGLEPSGNLGITNFNASIDGATTYVGGTAAGTVGDELLVDIDGSYTGYWDNWMHPACPNTQAGASIGVVEM